MIDSSQPLRARRLCANLSFLFTEKPFADRFAAAAQAGFTAVEMLFPYQCPADDLRRQLDDNGLTLALFNAPPGDWDGGERGLAALPGREAAFRGAIEQALDYAGALACDKIHVMAGIADPHDAEAARVYGANLAWAAERAGERGVRVLIEPINPFDIPGYFLADFDRAAALIAATPGLALQFDIYHCVRLDQDPLARLRQLLPITAHMQIAAPTGRAEPAEGELPLSALFRAMDRLGYQGRVGCEYRPAQATRAGLGWIEALEETLA